MALFRSTRAGTDLRQRHPALITVPAPFGMVRRLLQLVLGAILVISTPAPADARGESEPATARLAVAANFGNVARLLATQYETDSGHRIQISIASTGKLYAQIRQGAPFDVLLAADRATPERLLREDLAVAGSLHDYAIGRLVLLSASAEVGTASEALLREHVFRKFAIANPRTAPYGAAAREVLRHVGRLDELASHQVLGENVAQATQYVISGNADAGLVPWSLALQLPSGTGTSWWPVPADWHAPIVQSAVLLQRGQHNSAAVGFLAYLRSAAARQLIVAHGYD